LKFFKNDLELMKKQSCDIWPRKYNLFGVNVSETTYKEALCLIIRAAKKGMPAMIDHMPVHGLIAASQNPFLSSIMNSFNIVAPDGHPVRWALNFLHNSRLSDRVYGPELMLRVCRRAAEIGIGIYLYGSHPHVVEKLQTNLIRQFPLLQVVGCESPPFRPLTEEEDRTIIERINNSGAGVVFLGLGCPKQEVFAYEHRNSIRAVQVCVGAAFDFHAGNKKMAPTWMQRHALEWLFRLSQEPKRLWRRYFLTNTIYLFKFFLQLTGLKRF
jgi:exopolysaccharide biosynthesis WecB/TagA/CpsF family protein